MGIHRQLSSLRFLRACLAVVVVSAFSGFAQTVSGLSNTSAYDTYVATGAVAQTDLTAAKQLLTNGEYKKAARKLESAVKIEPHNSGLLDQLGLTYQRLAESSTFPSIEQIKAEGLYRRSMAADPRDPRPLRHLISMLLDPPSVCRTNLREIPSLIRRLAQIDPAEAREARQNLEWTAEEPTSLSERVFCAPNDALALVRRIAP